MIGQPEDAADLELIKEDIKKFESQNAGITVKLDVIPIENVRTILQTQLRSGKGPDVFGYDTGPGFAGALAKAGLLHDLTDAYAKYNWPIYDFAKQRVTFDGKLVGIPNQIETLGLFYNKDIFAKHGVGRAAEPARADGRPDQDPRRRRHPDGGQRQGRLAGRPPAEHVAVQRRRWARHGQAAQRRDALGLTPAWSRR